MSSGREPVNKAAGIVLCSLFTVRNNYERVRAHQSKELPHKTERGFTRPLSCTKGKREGEGVSNTV